MKSFHFDVERHFAHTQNYGEANRAFYFNRKNMMTPPSAKFPGEGWKDTSRAKCIFTYLSLQISQKGLNRVLKEKIEFNKETRYAYGQCRLDAQDLIKFLMAASNGPVDQLIDFSQLLAQNSS